MLNEKISVKKYHEKGQSYVKVGRNELFMMWLSLISIFCFNVNSEFMFDEQ